jgi:UDP-N-acetylglucosamine 2-epimerase (non-hydrolysing)
VRIVAALVGKAFNAFPSHALPGYRHPVLASRPGQEEELD